MDRAQALDPDYWRDQPFRTERHGAITVVREDFLAGGSKSRFLAYLLDPACDEFVFGAPFCGGAPYALSILAKAQGRRATLFYAARDRSRWHWRQRAAEANGAKICEVVPGWMVNVQAKARRYAEEAGAQFLPLGFDLPEAEAPFIFAMERLRRKIGGDPPEVWCATGSGMLARCLGKAFPSSAIKAVCVGLASRNGKQEYPPNVEKLSCRYKFEQRCEIPTAFSSCHHYDRKAWERCQQEAKPGALMWNVMG